MFAKEKATDPWPEEGEQFFEQELSNEHPPLVPKRLLDIPALRKMISTLKPRLPVSAVLYWEEFCRTRETAAESLCQGCKKFLDPLIGFNQEGCS